MSTVHLERRPRLAVLTIDRPPLNVLDIATLRELTAALAELRDDPALRAVVLRGAGRAFSAGVDVADHTVERVPAMLEAVAATITALRELPTMTLAAVHGHVLGGGLELALACDMVAAHPAARLGLPEIKLGVFAPYAALLLPPVVGPQWAARLLALGDTLDVAQAQAIGLVQQTWADEEALEQLLEALAEQSASALRLTKAALRPASPGLSGADLAAGLAEVHRLYLDQLMHTPDLHEGLAAFGERRPPRWEH